MSQLIVALDVPGRDQALALARQLSPEECRVKVGLELFSRAGPGIVAELADMGFGVFLDLKFHDIPNTVAQACRAVADGGAWMINVHCLGGPHMLQAAREAVDQSQNKPLLIGVTILTSHDQSDMDAIGLNGNPAKAVQDLASLAQKSGLDGVVCSAQEAASMRVSMGDEFVLVTPGVRMPGSQVQDQSRVTSPAAALAAGANYLVVGRPINQAPDPAKAVQEIITNMESANT